MLTNLRCPFGSFKLQLPLVESQLNQLPKDLALICIMRRGIVPLVVLHVFELVLRRDLVV